MDNEQLLKRGICPKCYRPLYESKYTDKILCDCEITTQPMDNTDKLKEIRDKYYKVLYEQEQTDNWVYKLSEVKQIQSQTLEYGKQLGREEVIEEMDKFIKELIEDTSIYGQQSSRNLRLRILNEWKDKLTSLKNPWLTGVSFL